MEGLIEIHVVRSALLIILMLITAGFTAMRFSYSNIFYLTYRPAALFSFKPIEGQLTGIRLMSTENFLATLLLCAVIAYTLLTFVLFQTQYDLSWLLFSGHSFWVILLNWLIITVVVAVFYVVKYFFLAFFGWLFNFPVRQSGHYQEYQSMGHVFYFFYALATGIGLISLNNMGQPFINMMLVVFAVFLLFRLFVLVFRLYAKGEFNILYIFSYLCTTEIIPLIIAFGIVLN